jgi:four helix bundle protein
MEKNYRKNKNRGFKQLRVWESSIELFTLVNQLLRDIPFEHNKTKSNILDAAHSINRNIAEGYCRKSPREYLNFLNFALGSCGELYSSLYAYEAAGIIDNKSFSGFDELHFKTENELLKLAKSIQQKIAKDEWDTNY